MTRNRRLLLVEDDPSTQHMMGVVLRSLGFQVTAATNGVDALAKLHRDNIELVITDWQMPEMDGIELCRRIRQEFSDRYIYVLMLTGRIDDHSYIDGLEAGADDFLIKPPDFEELRVRLKTGTRIIDLQSQLTQRNESLEQAYSRIRKDLDMAADTLRRRLPEPTRLPGFRFDWLFEPSSTIGGDIFDVVHHPGSDKAIFYQVDVAGHGIPAALASFSVQSLLTEAAARHLAAGADSDSWSTRPAAVASELNRRFQQAPGNDMYFTMLYGVLEQASGRGLLVQAGHPSPLHWRRASGDIVALGDSGFPIGLLPQAGFEAVPFQLQAGDRLLLYSDGISDCVDAADRSYGEVRLQAVLAETADRPLADAVAILRDELRAWRPTDQFEDDVSLLILEKTEQMER